MHVLKVLPGLASWKMLQSSISSFMLPRIDHVYMLAPFCLVIMINLKKYKRTLVWQFRSYSLFDFLGTLKSEILSYVLMKSSPLLVVQ